MNNAWEVQLRRPVHVRPVSPIVPLLVTGLCVVAGILLAVVHGGFGGGATVDQVVGALHATAAVRTPTTAAAHRKQVFDERRARFQGAARFRSAAAPTAADPTVRESP